MDEASAWIDSLGAHLYNLSNDLSLLQVVLIPKTVLPKVIDTSRIKLDLHCQIFLYVDIINHVKGWAYCLQQSRQSNKHFPKHILRSQHIIKKFWAN